MNIYYIQAAVFENTGIKVEVEQLMDILIELNLTTKSETKYQIFNGYNEFYDVNSKVKEDKAIDLVDVFSNL